jgi:L-alanine-DL-glutamate epimerase-like enolase superfamily enzyme
MLGDTVRRGLAAGYRTIKVKIGTQVEQDIEALPALRDAAGEDCRFRFDANQAYTPDEASRFLAAVESVLSPETELVEQPLPPHAWSDFARLARRTAVPLMLDESIRTRDDIQRAREVGARWIKLKLCKQGGVAEVLRAAELAADLQLGVVLGNGVATDVTNLLELSLQACHPNLFSAASESNGFAKLVEPLSNPDLRVEAGCAVHRPAPDQARPGRVRLRLAESTRDW